MALFINIEVIRNIKAKNRLDRRKVYFGHLQTQLIFQLHSIVFLNLQDWN